MYRKITEGLLNFLDAAPTCFHAVKAMTDGLLEAGFTPLSEEEKWSLTPGKGYFVTRNDSALIAFTLPKGSIKGWRIMASHSDSPTFKLKENPEIAVENHYVQLNVERYGGMIYSAWLDRPLSIAGRVVVEENHRLTTKLVNLDRDTVLIPNLAIHMNREINDGYRYNPQKDLLPLYGDIHAKGTLMKAVAEAAGCREEAILAQDLFLYNRQKGTIWGAADEFVSAARLDDLQCAYASLQGFLAGEKAEYACMHCVFDNEEVGSGTRQGAGSTFLTDTLDRICACLAMNREDFLISLTRSFMLSADNAHGVHPSHPDKADPVNRPYLNEGIVLKFNADQKYCTDGVSAAMFRQLCREAGVPYQTFTNRSDMPCGSTLGNISNTKVALHSADIGLPQLAMHSPYETAGTKDTAYLIQAAARFFQ